MADPTTWKDVGVEFAKQFPATVVAAGGVLGIIYKWVRAIRADQATQIANQNAIKVQLDGHTKLLRRASRAQGILEGHDRAKREVKQDLANAKKAVVEVVETVHKAQKRKARKSDKQ